MEFTLIDKSKWSRREVYEHYMNDNPCTFSMSVKLDITKIREEKRKIYPYLLYVITKAINNHEEFRFSFDEKKRLGFFSSMSPIYTIFHNDSKTFSNIYTEYNSDYNTFLSSYNRDMEKYKDDLRINPQENIPINTFPVSMIPWTSFDGFNLNIKNNYEYLSPIFTMGKFYEEGEKILLPFAIQINHSVCDGYHVCTLINEIQNEINEN